MAETKISYPIRMSKDVANEIDIVARRHGFSTRAKFMIHAARSFGQGSDERIAVELSRISYSLHQLDRAETGRLHLLKPRQLRELYRDARAAFSLLISRGAQ